MSCPIARKCLEAVGDGTFKDLKNQYIAIWYECIEFEPSLWRRMASAAARLTCSSAAPSGPQSIFLELPIPLNARQSGKAGLCRLEQNYYYYKILIQFLKFQHHTQWFRMGSMCNWNFVFYCNFPLQASFHPGSNSEYKNWFLDNNVKIQICICRYYCQLICFNLFSNFQFWWQPRNHFSKCVPAISCSNSIHFSYEVYFMPKF